MSPRVLLPSAICAALTAVALLLDLGPVVAAVLVLLLIVSPLVTAWFANRDDDALTYLAAGIPAAATIAVVGGVINEIRSDDYTTGIVFIVTVLVGLAFTLPP